jgi:tetraprenyl-beta-curcumene synthase
VDQTPPYWFRGRGLGAAPDPRDALACLHVETAYWLRIYPRARRELAGWEELARGIPDGTLRQHALGKLSGEGLNAEAAAVFAVLAPRTRRRRVLRLTVAYQVLYDFLDAVNEDPAYADLETGLQLHRALIDAVVPDRRFVANSQRVPRDCADGGYTRALRDVCRRLVRSLPGTACCADVLARSARRCAEAQSHNHAIATSGEAPLIEWSLAQAAGRSDGPWWELAAGGVSSLAVHALLASAADPASTRRDALEVDAAYFPSICALSTLLDSLADYYRDADTPSHSFIARYRSADHAAERLVAIAAESAEGIKRLRKSRLHATILAGIVAYYLSSPSVDEGFPAAAAESLVRHVGPLVVPMRAIMRARRHAIDS